MPFTRTNFDDFLDRQVQILDGKSFYARLAGVSHENADGTSRQVHLTGLRPCDELMLCHEPDNEFDSNAVRVSTKAGAQVGYLESRLAGETVRRWSKGVQTRAFVSNLSGGRAGQSIGCTLGIVTYTVVSL